MDKAQKSGQEILKWSPSLWETHPAGQPFFFICFIPKQCRRALLEPVPAHIGAEAGNLDRSSVHHKAHPHSHRGESPIGLNMLVFGVEEGNWSTQRKTHIQHEMSAQWKPGLPSVNPLLQWISRPLFSSLLHLSRHSPGSVVAACTGWVSEPVQ